MSAIEFRSVTKAYRNRRVIDALTFTIQSGERVVLFGPSGCGKSTTVFLIAGLGAADAGYIGIDGRVASAGRRIIVPPQSRSVAMVFQDLALWPHMSVAENIAPWPFARKSRALYPFGRFEPSPNIRRH